MKKLPDIERMLSRIYTYSAKSTVKAIYIDIAVINRLDEFYTLLNYLKRLRTIIQEVMEDSNAKNIKSKRLRALLTFRKVVVKGKFKKNEDGS
jgi:hypothetical protein